MTQLSILTWSVKLVPVYLLNTTETGDEALALRGHLVS